MTCEGDDTDTDQQLRYAISLNPGVTSINIEATNLSSAGLYSFMSCQHLQDLHITNTDLFLVDFDEGVAPVLSVCGHSLVSLSLDKFKHVDIGFIGTHCPKLKFLALEHIIYYGKLFVVNEVDSIVSVCCKQVIFRNIYLFRVCSCNWKD